MHGEDDFPGVRIGHGESEIWLRPTGEPSEYGFPTLIEIKAGPFSGAFRDRFVGSFGTFHQQLSELNRTLKGRAVLGSLEGHLELVLWGEGLGGIAMQGKVVASQVPRIALTFEGLFDQSYLPKILRDIRRYFLAASTAPNDV